MKPSPRRHFVYYGALAITTAVIATALVVAAGVIAVCQAIDNDT
jgi:hypothetical protein